MLKEDYTFIFFKFFKYSNIFLIFLLSFFSNMLELKSISKRFFILIKASPNIIKISFFPFPKLLYDKLMDVIFLFLINDADNLYFKFFLHLNCSKINLQM